jgi:hypothetical protein
MAPSGLHLLVEDGEIQHSPMMYGMSRLVILRWFQRRPPLTADSHRHPDAIGTILGQRPHASILPVPLHRTEIYC